MPRIVESKTCPTCGHDKGTVQKFDIPEIPVLDTETLKLIQANSASKDDIKTILAKLEDVRVPAVLKSTCEEHPELCQHQAQIDTLTAELNERKQGHDVLTKEHLQAQYDSCPNCHRGIDEFGPIWAEKNGYKKAEPVAAGPTSPVTKPTIEKMPWE